MIRYAEVLLNLAEARVRTSNAVDAQAIALLNAIRGRSDATTVFSAGDLADATALADAILKESRIELLGEGFAGKARCQLHSIVGPTVYLAHFMGGIIVKPAAY